MIGLRHPSRFLPALVRFQSISGFCLERAAMHWRPGYWRGEGWSLSIRCVSSLIASLPFSIPVVPATVQFRDHCYSFWGSSLRPSAGPGCTVMRRRPGDLTAYEKAFSRSSFYGFSAFHARDFQRWSIRLPTASRLRSQHSSSAN